jgi:uncharacterized membrane protein
MTRARPTRPKTRGEEGQSTVLILGFAVVVMMTVVAVVDASAAYLRRQHLDSLADGAALAAADGVREAQVYEGGLQARADIDPTAAAGRVAHYLTSVEAQRHYPGLRYSVEARRDRVVVHVSAPLELPFPVPGVVSTTEVAATAAAVVAVGG